MKNAQRFVFTAIVAAILVDVGSFTKFQNIWSMAFSTPPTQDTVNGSTYTGAQAANNQVTPSKLAPNGKIPAGIK